jgi:hypothetical protein
LTPCLKAEGVLLAAPVIRLPSTEERLHGGLHSLNTKIRGTLDVSRCGDIRTALMHQSPTVLSRGPCPANHPKYIATILFSFTGAHRHTSFTTFTLHLHGTSCERARWTLQHITIEIAHELLLSSPKIILILPHLQCSSTPTGCSVGWTGSLLRDGNPKTNCTKRQTGRQA